MSSQKSAFRDSPPAVNFFTSVDDENSDLSEAAVTERAETEQRRLEQLKKMTASGDATLKSVDSEIFDNGPFQQGFHGGAANGHVVSSPFEISHYPIEIQEGKIALQRQISNRARLESSNYLERDQLCLSPMSGNGIAEELERECLSPQHIEMHTFRDAIDVNYQRMALTGEELSGVPLEDLKSAAALLIEALKLREEYMDRIGSRFPNTTKHFISNHFPKNLPKYRKKNTEQTN
ncbi:hypothetical protein L596_014929 [Steinernema carpocapsae]|uniref:Uncharacterized protein n=1 Tax=Steinernema carpocapsae TaxID=34508 RepID=A0A4U5NDN7_STECR|nr:hypothetical protein L596_014929 [Steinernema carpocapsae]